MKLIKFIIVLFGVCTAFSASAGIKITKEADAGYGIPKYTDEYKDQDWKDSFVITAYARPKTFPLSSLEQGSVLYEIFADLAEKEHIIIKLKVPTKNDINGFDNIVKKFEKGYDLTETDLEIRNAVFGLYYENRPYSKMEYIYPAIFENQVFIITDKARKINITHKNSLKSLKGAYVGDDYFSTFVLKDFASLGLKKIETFSDAYEELLTGKIDFIAANYYKSRIEAYQLGVNKYLLYSKTPVWKMPLFLAVMPEFAAHPRMSYLKKYLKSNTYKTLRDKKFAEMLEIYKKNTQGVVPPTYTGIKTSQPINEDADTENQQLLEN